MYHTKLLWQRVGRKIITKMFLDNGKYPADPKNINRVPNFLSKKLCTNILNEYSNSSQLNPENKKSAMMFLDTPFFFEYYINKVCETVSYRFGLDVSDFANTHIRKWYPEEYQLPHSDCEAVFTYKNAQPKMTEINNFSSIFIEYAALVYLNNDYEGGEIYFPEFNLEIKPEVGELIFFPGTHLYMHGVRPIKSGNRFVIQNFLTTPKLKYLWEVMILDESPINFVDLPQEKAMQTKNVFTRNNIPKHFKEWQDAKRVVQSQ